MRVAVLMAVGAVCVVVLMVAHFSHGATAGAEAFAMTSGTAVAFEMTAETGDSGGQRRRISSYGDSNGGSGDLKDSDSFGDSAVTIAQWWRARH